MVVDRTMYISGQLGLDPAKMELVDGGVVQEADMVPYLSGYKTGFLSL